MAKQISMSGYSVFGERYIATENLKTPGGVELELVATSIADDPVVHAVAVASTYSEGVQALQRLLKTVEEAVANVHWLALTPEADVALGRPKELGKYGIGLIVVKLGSTFGLGSASILTELDAKVQPRRRRWENLEEALRAKGKSELAEALVKSIGRKPRF